MRREKELESGRVRCVRYTRTLKNAVPQEKKERKRPKRSKRQTRKHLGEQHRGKSGRKKGRYTERGEWSKGIREHMAGNKGEITICITSILYQRVFGLFFRSRSYFLFFVFKIKRRLCLDMMSLDGFLVITFSCEGDE